MRLIDHLITALLWGWLAYLAVGFVAYATKRSGNTVPVSQSAEPEAVALQAIEVSPVDELAPKRKRRPAKQIPIANWSGSSIGVKLNPSPFLEK